MTNYLLLKLIADAGEYRLADIALRLAAKNEALFIELASEAGLEVPTATYEVNANLRTTVHPHQMSQIKEAYERDHYGKVPAIKVAREVLGLGLKDAKDLVEHLMAIGVLPKKPAYDTPNDDPLRSRW